MYPRLYAHVCRGKNKDTLLTPHRYVRDGGRYHLAMRKGGPYVGVDTEEQVINLLKENYRLRMSNRQEKYPPSLISRNAIHGWK